MYNVLNCQNHPTGCTTDGWRALIIIAEEQVVTRGAALEEPQALCTTVYRYGLAKGFYVARL